MKKRIARKEGKAEGRAQGIAEGIKEGKAKGIKEGKREGKILGLKSVAKEMLKNNEDIELIKKYTGLSNEELEKIKTV